MKEILRTISTANEPIANKGGSEDGARRDGGVCVWGGGGGGGGGEAKERNE